ncbi:hypothetical protein FRB95_007986 [Tulasnella sp. JGI-2019a]|nr:hypothetical protein FRB95_007986 [Tulasnella sp. JGI-2019a]
MLVEGSTGLAESSSSLAAVSRVNRHWNRIADRMLYKIVELKDYLQLHRLIKTLDRNHAKRALVCDLRIPNAIPYPPALFPTRGLSTDSQLRGQQRAQAQTNERVIHLLTLPTQLTSLDIYGGAVQLWVEGTEVAIQPKPLPNLSTISSLCLRGSHDDRWRFLLKYTSGLTHFRASPDWTITDDPSLPFGSYDLQSLALIEGTHLILDHFSLLVQASSTPLSNAVFQSNIRNLELVNVPTTLSSLRLSHFIGLLSPTLESLRISSTRSEETEHITEVLTQTLPTLTRLTHLNTSARTFSVFSSSLHSLTITLGSTGRPPSTISTETIQGTMLKQLTIIDPAMQDYLFFNLVGSRDYGNEVEMEKQDRLWMQAGKAGVVITVVNPAKRTDYFKFKEIQA